MFALISTTRSLGKRRRMSIWVAAVCLLLTVAATLAMIKRDRSLEKQRFAALAGERIGAVREELQRPIQLVNLVHETIPTPLWNRPETIQQLGEQLHWQTPAITALTVVHEPDQSAKSDSDFQHDPSMMWESDSIASDENRVARWQRVLSVLVTTRAPQRTDMESENLWSVLRWDDTASQRSTDSSKCLIVSRPILSRSAPISETSPTQASAQSTVIGWIVMEMNIDLAAEDALERLTAIPLKVTFQSRQPKLPTGVNDVADVTANDGWSLTKSVTFADEQWLVVAEAPAVAWKNSHEHMPWFFFAAGLFATVSLTAYIASVTGQTQRIETQVQRQTAELREANAQLKREVATRRRVEERISDYAMDLEKTNQHLEEARAEMEQTLIELKERNRELDEFNYVASHDLQEPVRKLISFSTLLRQDLGSDLCETAEQDLYYIVDAAHRMKQLIADLLAFSRTGREAMRREPVDLNECLQAALDALFLPIEESRAEIRREVLPVVMGDRTMLTQLFQNLIGNSIKFSEDTTPVIEVSTESHGDSCTIMVKDNGIGIRAKYCERIFLPFQRLHGSAKFAGNGIGLAICRKTVSRHGGRIWVESELGHGAKFYFTLSTVGEPAMASGTLADLAEEVSTIEVSTDRHRTDDSCDRELALITTGERRTS